MWPYAYPSLRNTVWKNARANIGTLSIFAIIRADLDQNDLIGRIKPTTVDWIPLIWIHVLIHNWSNRLSTRKNWFVQFNHSTTIHIIHIQIYMNETTHNTRYFFLLHWVGIPAWNDTPLIYITHLHSIANAYLSANTLQCQPCANTKVSFTRFEYE